MKVGKAWKVVPTCIKDEATQRKKTNSLAIGIFFVCLFTPVFYLYWLERTEGVTHTELKQYVRAHFCWVSITSCLCHKLLLVSELPPSSPLLSPSPCPLPRFFEHNQRNPSPLPPSYFSSLLIIFNNLSLPHSLPTHSKRPLPYFPSLFIIQQANREE